ncbi:MAG: winged helix-turn-helix domain-containing protein [Christensenellales bacterium]|uniref:winged helix-turn-helix domain-containing protein n=1 Tax=Butyribacter sp. TaxID=2822465 RepID=UPI002A986774|nr:response regulator transcription factor [Clostridium sp.]MDY5181380.1 response regulator transcription factor [Butyribacter sp.]
MIWCVEDDVSIRDIEVYTLEQTGFIAKGFGDGDSFWMELATTDELPELVILDIMLPGEDGVSLLTKIKASSRTKDIPVIMATAKSVEYDKIKSLDLGADDYLVKPFGMMEMVSRIKAVLRRCMPKKENKTKYVNGIIELNVEEHTVLVDGKSVSLTYKEYEILKIFLMHPGMAYTRNQLLSEVWGIDSYGETRTVDMHIKTLRQKLGDGGRYITTVRNVGYKMEGYND